jgi:hypothetical protein
LPTAHLKSLLGHMYKIYSTTRTFAGPLRRNSRLENNSWLWQNSDCWDTGTRRNGGTLVDRSNRTNNR